MSNAVAEQQPEVVEDKKQIYLQRVNQLYTDIRNWLQDEPLVLENGSIDSLT